MSPSCFGLSRGPANAAVAVSTRARKMAMSIGNLRNMGDLVSSEQHLKLEDIAALLEQFLSVLLYLYTHFLLDLHIEIDDDGLVRRLHFDCGLARGKQHRSKIDDRG